MDGSETLPLEQVTLVCHGVVSSTSITICYMLKLLAMEPEAPWWISVAVFGLAAMENIHRYCGFFRHNPLWRCLKVPGMRGFWLPAIDNNALFWTFLVFVDSLISFWIRWAGQALFGTLTPDVIVLTLLYSIAGVCRIFFITFCRIW